MRPPPRLAPLSNLQLDPPPEAGPAPPRPSSLPRAPTPPAGVHVCPHLTALPRAWTPTTLPLSSPDRPLPHVSPSPAPPCQFLLQVPSSCTRTRRGAPTSAPRTSPRPPPHAGTSAGSAPLALVSIFGQASPSIPHPVRPPPGAGTGAPGAPSRSPPAARWLGVVAGKLAATPAPGAVRGKVLRSAAGAARPTALVPAGGGAPGRERMPACPLRQLPARVLWRPLPAARDPPPLFPPPGFRSWSSKRRWLRDWQWEVPGERRLVGEAESTGPGPSEIRLAGPGRQATCLGRGCGVFVGGYPSSRAWGEG